MPISKLSFVSSLACLAFGWVSSACGGEQAPVYLELSSAVGPVDEARVSVFSTRGALVLDERLEAEAGPLALPGKVVLRGPGRSEQLRVQVWGFHQGMKVGFGSSPWLAGSDHEVPLRLDRPPIDRDGDGVPDSLDGCPDVADPDQSDADEDGRTDACLPGCLGDCDRRCEGNLFSNGGFEDGVSGWSTSGGALTRVEPGYRGQASLRVCKQPTGVASGFALVLEEAAPVSPTPGARYRLSFRAKARMGGDAVNAHLRAPVPSGAPQTVSLVHPVSSSWSAGAVELGIGSAQTTRLEVAFEVVAVADGYCFDVDEVCLQRLD